MNEKLCKALRLKDIVIVPVIKVKWLRHMLSVRTTDYFCDFLYIDIVFHLVNARINESMRQSPDMIELSV